MRQVVRYATVVPESRNKCFRVFLQGRTLISCWGRGGGEGAKGGLCTGAGTTVLHHLSVFLLGCYLLPMQHGVNTYSARGLEGSVPSTLVDLQRSLTSKMQQRLEEPFLSYKRINTQKVYLAHSNGVPSAIKKTTRRQSFYQ